MDITSIAANVNNGFLHGNRYTTILGVPAAVSPPGNLRLVGENCSDATIPGASYLTFDWKNAGPVIKVPYDIVFEPLVLTFYEDREAQASKFFRDWNRSVMTDNFRMEFFDQYTADITVIERDQTNASVLTYNFVNAYAAQISGVQLSYKNQDMIREITVTFNYEYYEVS